jgi:hypothetical protein
MIYKLLAAGAILIAAVLGGYFYGKSEVTALWEADKAVWQANYDKQVKETDRVNAERESKAQEIEDALKQQLVAAESSVSGLSRRLRLASSRGVGTVSCDSSVGGGTEPASGVSDSIEEIERDSDATWTAAATDSARFTACQLKYNSLRQ